MDTEFHQEADWDIEERHADDKGQAEEKAEIRKKSGAMRGEKNKKAIQKQPSAQRGFL